MSNFSDFFPVAEGGGGGIPKYQEFTSSGTFTPSQALIDAGGRVFVFLVGGGSSGSVEDYGGGGGEVLLFYDTLTTTSAITVTIAASTTSSTGNSSVWNGDDAGGTLITAAGGVTGNYGGNFQSNKLTAGFGARSSGSTPGGGAGSGVFGYGAGGSSWAGPGVMDPKANSGQGSWHQSSGGSGFARITWFE